MTKRINQSEIEVTPLGMCPCGKIIGTIGDTAVIHGTPTCDAFKNLEPDEFLTYVRRSRGIPDSALLEQ